MAFQQFKLAIATSQARGIFNQYVYETDDTAADTQVAGYFNASRFADDPDWFGSFITVKASDTTYTGEISSGGTVAPNPGGVDPNFTTLTEGQVPKADGSAQLVYSGATVDPSTLEWTFDETINIPVGSLNVGPDVTVSGFGITLGVTSNSTDTDSVVVSSEVDPLEGILPPVVDIASAQQTLLETTVDTDFSNAYTAASPLELLIEPALFQPLFPEANSFYITESTADLSTQPASQQVLNEVWVGTDDSGGDPFFVQTYDTVLGDFSIVLNTPQKLVIGQTYFSRTVPVGPGSFVQKGERFTFGITSITRVGTTATVTTTVPHGESQVFYLDNLSGADQSDYNVLTTRATVTGLSEFTYEVANEPTTPATGTITYGTFADKNKFTGYAVTDHEVALYPPTVIPVYNSVDVTELGPTIEIEENTTLVMNAQVDIGSTNFEVSNQATLFFSGVVGPNPNITYSGSDPFISCDGTFRATFCPLISTGTGDLFNITSGNFVAIITNTLIGWDSLGTVNEAGFFVNRFLTYVNIGAGVDIINTSTVLQDVKFATPPTSTFYKITGPEINTHQIDAVVGELDFPLFRIDPGINNASRVLVTAAAITGATLFDTTGGTTGTFTNTTDMSVVQAITGVIDSPLVPGRARFQFSGGPPSVRVDQEVTQSTFVTNTDYNVSGFIIETDLTSYYELRGVDFGSDEVGQFRSDIVRFVDIGTSLVEGDTLTIKTDGGGTYNGGMLVTEASTDAFRGNRVFAGSATGTWNTAGIDQTDPRVLAHDNPGHADSESIASAFVNNNSAVTTIATSNTFNDIDFGTLIEGSNTERFQLIDTGNGTIEYMGNAPFSGFINFDFTGVSSGGAVEFRFRFQVDTGAGFVDLADPVEALVEVGGTASSVSKHIPLSLVKGDKVKPEVTRNSGTSTIIISYATITVI